MDFSDYEQVFNNFSVPVSCCDTTNPLVNETTCPDIVRDTNVPNATELMYTQVLLRCSIYVMRKQWIGTINGLRCSKYMDPYVARAIHGLRSTCAGNPWIAQHLRDPWIAQPKHTCQPFVQKKKKGTKVISRERKEIVGEPVLDEVSWISLIRLDLPILSVQLLVRKFTTQENGIRSWKNRAVFYSYYRRCY